MERVDWGRARAGGSEWSAGSIYLVNHNADNTLVTLRYRFKDARWKQPKSRSKLPATSSIAARSSFAKRRAAELQQAAAESGRAGVRGDGQRPR